ncbi:MAG: FkbM family methyltransferase [Roseiarcus sp.]
MSEQHSAAAAQSTGEIANPPAPGGFLAMLLIVAGRFRPTGRLAKTALRALRARQMIPKFVASRVNGRPIALDLDEDVDAKIFLFGAYDERGLRLIKRVMRAVDCRTALDVGANVGNHTAYFSDWARRVYAFELNPPVFERLQAFVAGARLANVTAFPCGLSDRDDERTYYVFPGQAHLTTFEPGPGAVAAGRVRVRRGDSIVAEAGIADIDVIKIDVEEHEFEVLNGLRATLARDRPVLFMEFKENSAAKFGGPAGLAAFLEGYRIFGTGKGAMSRLFKTALRLEPFVAGKYYVHVVCVPEHRIAALGKAGLRAD